MSAIPQSIGSPSRVPLTIEVNLNHTARRIRDHYSYPVHFRSTPAVQKMEEEIRTHLPKGISFADFQRSIYQTGLQAFSEYLRNTGIRLSCNSFATLQAMAEEDGEWDKFLAALPELKTRVQQDVDKRNYGRAEDRIRGAIQTVREYCGDSILATRTLRNIYTWIPEELAGRFGKIRVLFGLEDFAPADPNEESEG